MRFWISTRESEFTLRLGQFLFVASRAHFGAIAERDNTLPMHGPQSWSWWHLFSVRVLDLAPQNVDVRGLRTWIYTRWGAVHLDAYRDRRNLVY